jgi:hypothetical protein
MAKTKTMLTECPNCGATWGIGSEEFEWQECDCCGYPDNDGDDLDDDDYYYDDDDLDDEDCDQNDSRNL